MKIEATRILGRKAEMRKFFGAGIQEATRTDANGKRFYEAFPREWESIFLDHIRSPNGTDSYDISSGQDADVRLALDTLIPQKGCKSHVTWPYQLDATNEDDFVSDATDVVVAFNEPPNHTPSTFADGDAYVADAQTLYDGLSSYSRARFWCQTGKPEAIRYGGLSPTGEAKHQTHLDALSLAVAAGDLPARIATTHKSAEDYPVANRYDLYDELIQDYMAYFGPEVQVLFHEQKNKGATVEVINNLELHMEFLLIMARLMAQYGTDRFGGGTYQQLAGVGTVNIFGMNDLPQNGGVWTIGGIYRMWALCSAMREYTYVYTNQTDKPDKVQIELFRKGREEWLYFSNRGPLVDLSTNGQQIAYIDESLEVTTTKYKGYLPAHSVGYIRRNVVKRERPSIFYFIRNLMNG